MVKRLIGEERFSLIHVKSRFYLVGHSKVKHRHLSFLGFPFDVVGTAQGCQDVRSYYKHRNVDNSRTRHFWASDTRSRVFEVA